MNPLLDKEFLKQLDNSTNKETYARITALDINELPLEQIEGKVTGGSVNIDGASAIRRTCSVSLIASEVNINNFYWGLNNRFKLEIGLKNTINPNYDEIIWFQQGIFVITSFNTSLSTNNYTISINGKDKMCLLDGSVDGQLPASVDFGVEEFKDNNGIITYNQIPIKKIIKEMVHTYAREPYRNIIINDLPSNGLELLEYRGESPMYLAYNQEAGNYTQMYFNGDVECNFTPVYENAKPDATLATIEEKGGSYNKRIDSLLDTKESTIYFNDDKTSTPFSISKIEYGDTVGYRLTDLIYPGELISNIGESITSVLDKIVNTLTNFEYFYDLQGRFVFQAKRNYINTSWNSIVTIDEDQYVEDAAYVDSVSYYFDGNNLITAFQNTPDLNNVRNDYSIWGARTSVSSGAEIPVHYRYAIHEKPLEYTSINVDPENNKLDEKAINSYNSKYNVNIKGQESVYYSTDDYDWREILFRMAADYYKYNFLEDFELKVIDANKNNKYNKYSLGTTGYEQFYIDIQGFWRDIYNPEPEEKYYLYTPKGDQETFALPEDSEGDYAYLKEYYVLTDEEASRGKRNDVLVLKEYEVDDVKYLELQKLIDTIKFQVEFDEEGKQDIYYISGKIDPYYVQCTEEDQYNEYAVYYLRFEMDIDPGHEIEGSDPGAPSSYNPEDRYFYIAAENITKEKFEAEKTKYYLQYDIGYKAITPENVNQVLKTEVYIKEKIWEAEGRGYIIAYNLLTDAATIEPGTVWCFKTNTKDEEYFSVENCPHELWDLYWARVHVGDEEYDPDDILGPSPGVRYAFENKTYYHVHELNKYGEPIIDQCTNYTSFNEELKYWHYPMIAVTKGEDFKETFDENKSGIYYVKDESGIYSPAAADDHDKDLYVKSTEFVRAINLLKEEYDKNRDFYYYYRAPKRVNLTYYIKYFDYYKDTDLMPYWKKDVVEAPDLLNFWIDFLDSTKPEEVNNEELKSDLQKYSIAAIGDRPKVVNDTNVKSIYFREVPNLIFTTYDDFQLSDYQEKTGYVFMFVNDDINNYDSSYAYFTISAQGKSAKDALDELLYQHSYCTESINITAIPIYYLEPNTRISVRDDTSKINGEYIISRITLPLTYNGTMSIQATKAPQRLY